MNKGTISNGTITVVESRQHGVEVATYGSRMEMVKDILDHGALSSKSLSYLSEDHVRALSEIRNHCRKLIHKSETLPCAQCGRRVHGSELEDGYCSICRL